MARASAISERNRRAYNEAVDLTNRIICAKDDREARFWWERALELAKLCEIRESRSADVRYLLGYIYYEAPAKTDKTRREAETFLKGAIELDPNHHLARYCLACLFF